MRNVARLSQFLVCIILVVVHSTVTNAQENEFLQSLPGPLANVDPFIGTGGGNNDFPGAVVPFGMVSISPDTELTNNGGFKYGDPYIMGFSQVHEEGVGCSDLGNILIVPTTGAVATTESGYESPYSNLVASPGYFKATLNKYGTTAEMTATIHASYNQYTFPPRSGDANIMIDVTHSLSPYVQGGTVQVVSPTEVQGLATSGHRCGHDNLQTVYFDAKFSKPASTIGTWLNGAISTATSQTGQHVGAYFRTSTAANEVITVRIGVSYTSVANAALNVDTEIPAGTAFNKVLSNAENAWNTELSKITVAGGTADQQKMFYTALYHSLMIPNVLSDVNGQYPGPNNTGVKTASGYVQYDFFNTWDQQRSNFALLALGWPERVADMMKSVLAIYQNSGWLPTWHFAGNETTTMVGDPIDPILTGSYLRGIHTFDINVAYAAMIHGATQTGYQRPGQDVYEQYGYIPADNTGATGYVWGSVSTSLEYYYDDWSIAQLAQALGKTGDYQTYMAHSANYPKLFNPAVGFFQSRNANGSWVRGFDPTLLSDPGFVEGTPWQYLWNVAQDLPGLITLLGGNAGYISKLQNYFSHNLWTVTNEHDLYDPYLFDYVPGQAPQTQYQIRLELANCYSTTPSGIASTANDDSGALSSFFVFSAMGFYPVSPASLLYMIGSPIFDTITIALNPAYYPGDQFTIQALNNSAANVYIQSASWNGQPKNDVVLNHSDIAQGGTLILNMGAAPSNWGGGGSTPTPTPAITLTMTSGPTPTDIILHPGRTWTPY